MNIKVSNWQIYDGDFLIKKSEKLNARPEVIQFQRSLIMKG